MPVGPTKFDLNRCYGAKNLIFGLSKFNTGRLPLRGNPAGNENSSVNDVTSLVQARTFHNVLEQILVGNIMRIRLLKYWLHANCSSLTSVVLFQLSTADICAVTFHFFCLTGLSSRGHTR